MYIYIYIYTYIHTYTHIHTVIYVYVCMYICIYIYIYIYIKRGGESAAPAATANLRTKILDFRGFDSSRILILSGGILVSIGDFPESLSQQILAGRILVGQGD